MRIEAMAIGLVLVGVLATGNLAAQDSRRCGTGTLLALDTRTETTAGISNGHYEEKTKKDGKKVIDGHTYNSAWTRTFYVLTVSLGDMTYTAENPQNIFFGYNPTDMVVNDPVDVCIDKNKLTLTRPDGKEYRTRIVRTERKLATRNAGDN